MKRGNIIFWVQLKILLYTIITVLQKISYCSKIYLFILNELKKTLGTFKGREYNILYIYYAYIYEIFFFTENLRANITQFCIFLICFSSSFSSAYKHYLLLYMVRRSKRAEFYEHGGKLLQDNRKAGTNYRYR